MYGAFRAYSAVGSLAPFLTQVLGDGGAYDFVGADTYRDVVECVSHRFPLLASYLDGTDILHGNISEIITRMSVSVRKAITYYIWRRVLWSLGCMVAAVLVVVLCRGERGGRKEIYASGASLYANPDDF